ncbi:MAG: glycosyltransferase family 9 protein [Blastocatellia bacterium]|nr:glycosyltransferase family 9 protein [Blastocatellia bacterium]
MIEWSSVRRVLVVRLRSIGDTVLATPSLIALRRFLPDAKIDVLLEDWVAPVLDGFEAVDRVVPIGKGTLERIKTARALRKTRYDAVFDLHGGTTASLIVRATGARHRVGYSHYRYSSFYTELLSSSADFWKQAVTHSAEQQLALVGFAGVPVEDRPRTSLAVTDAALASIENRLNIENSSFALLHPSAAFATKQWPAENFARVSEYLAARGIKRVAIAAKHERAVLDRLAAASRVPVLTFDDLTLPEITALASKAKLFIGNDSGIAHIAAAVNTPSVVIFGSSNRDHWRPWTDAPNEIVFHPLECQPCPGYECKVFGEPRCILSVPPENVIAAIDRLL